jgi:alpha-ketoglutarate-dependent dioxygenase alkB family protein 2
MDKLGLSVPEPPKINLVADLPNNLFVYIDQNFYNKKISNNIFKQLREQIIYDENSVVRIHGRDIKIPRSQTAYGDPGTKYKFSGHTVQAKPWISILDKIKYQVERVTGKTFNFCLINYYANGQNYIGYHKDDERDLGPTPWIASLSFGQERKFYFKSDNKSLPVVKLKLCHGSLCVIMHPTNKHWKHSVPKETAKNCPNPRINLTFRYIKPDLLANPKIIEV